MRAAKATIAALIAAIAAGAVLCAGAQDARPTEPMQRPPAGDIHDDDRVVSTYQRRDAAIAGAPREVTGAGRSQ